MWLADYALLIALAVVVLFPFEVTRAAFRPIIRTLEQQLRTPRRWIHLALIWMGALASAGFAAIAGGLHEAIRATLMLGPAAIALVATVVAARVDSPVRAPLASKPLPAVSRFGAIAIGALFGGFAIYLSWTDAAFTWSEAAALLIISAVLLGAGVRGNAGVFGPRI